MLTELAGPSAIVFGEGPILAQPFVMSPLGMVGVIGPFLTLFSMNFWIHGKTLLIAMTFHGWNSLNRAV